LIALVNILRYQKGVGPLGPLNQTLYGLKNGVGYDVTQGQTYAISRSSCSRIYFPGFEATEGWDLTTGLGSPRFQTLVEQLVDLGNSN